MALTDYLPISTKGELILQGSSFFGTCVPVFGLLPEAARYIGVIADMPNAAALGNVTAAALAAGMTPFVIAKARALWSTKGVTMMNQLEFEICGMKFSEEDLFTNILITGTIGSGKTSTAIFNALEKLFLTYSREKAAFDKDPLMKMGGISLDAKGEFYESILWFCHCAKRNILEDVVIIRPNTLLPTAGFKDERGRDFYLSAIETSFGSEIKHLFEIRRSKEGINMAFEARPDSDGKEEVVDAEILAPVNVFGLHSERRKLFEDHLARLRFNVVGQKMNYIGWRWEGERLVRVLQTPGFGELEYARDKAGNKIYADPPKLLRFSELFGVDNGHRYNIVNPLLPPGEVAKRLTNIGKLIDGEGGGGGDNPYFDKAAARQIAMVVQAWRTIKKEQCSGPDIMRVTTQASESQKLVQDLKAKKELLELEIAKTKEQARLRDLKNTHKRIEDMINYFMDSWEKLEPKTKSIVQSVVSNMFGEFLTDGTLQESFCSPATYSFEQCITEGKFFCFLPGREYEGLAKVMGTSLKMDFQSVMLGRPFNAQLNKSRVVLCVIDECQVYAVAGGAQGAGDENFMAMSRQSRTINMMATQSDASLISVIGANKADVYLQSYGGRIWFHNSDPKTNERASNMCGKINKEQEEINRSDISFDKAFGVDKSDKIKREFKFSKQARFAPEAYNNLDKFECITFNKGRKGVADKSTRRKDKPNAIGGHLRPKVADMMRWYIQAYCENMSFKRDAERFKSDDEKRKIDPNYVPQVVGRSFDHEATEYSSTTTSSSATPEAVKPATAIKRPASRPEPLAPQTRVPLEHVEERAEQKNPVRTVTPTSPQAQPSRLDSDEARKLWQRRGIEIIGPEVQQPDGKDPEDEEDEGDEADGTPRREVPPQDIAEAYRAGNLSFAQLEDIRRFYTDKNTNIALVIQFVETLSPGSLYHPQKIVNASAQQSASDPAARPPPVSPGPRGMVAGNERLVRDGYPPNILRNVTGEEKLDLTEFIAKQRTDAATRLRAAAAEASRAQAPTASGAEESDNQSPGDSNPVGTAADGEPNRPVKSALRW